MEVEFRLGFFIKFIREQLKRLFHLSTDINNNKRNENMKHSPSPGIYFKGLIKILEFS